MASIVNRSLSAISNKSRTRTSQFIDALRSADRLTPRPRGCWPLFRRRCVQSGSDCVESRYRAIPAQLVCVVEERDVRPESGERSKEHCALPFPAKSVCKGTRVSGVHAPFAAVGRDVFEMEKLGKHGGRRLRTPAWQARIAICRIAH